MNSSNRLLYFLNSYQYWQ